MLGVRGRGLWVKEMMWQKLGPEVVVSFGTGRLGAGSGQVEKGSCLKRGAPHRTTNGSVFGRVGEHRHKSADCDSDPLPTQCHPILLDCLLESLRQQGFAGVGQEEKSQLHCCFHFCYIYEKALVHLARVPW